MFQAIQRHLHQNQNHSQPSLPTTPIPEQTVPGVKPTPKEYKSKLPKSDAELGGHYKTGRFAPYTAGQVAPYKATHPLILGPGLTPIRPFFKKISFKISKKNLM